jgi:hypothetical protein
VGTFFRLIWKFIRYIERILLPDSNMDLRGWEMDGSVSGSWSMAVFFISGDAFSESAAPDT